ncbi:RNA-binding protein [Leucobacter chromiireducens]|uniref:RNA-binding protein KhpA n=1 Tax=Leucobacter chromiireducens subsp. solipictus TaxID=398235 RepID=A0ABS1SGP4_9MICO|nr:RNA-binding protein [Leucobacter chromiireducens]MBL3679581.1 RNA-binding protein [Leucobacter chromiireducens subsp. solipictus]
MAQQALADALEHLVRGIVDHPDRVRVDTRGGGARGEILEVRVHPEDLGRVIGRGGRTASSLRTVVSSLAAGERVRVDVVDTDDAAHAAPAPAAAPGSDA